MMLARQLDGVIVIAGADRYLSGRLAEHHLGATVHVLDDGFQHFRLDRDVDIVLVSAADLRDARTLPSGPLREPADVLTAAEAVVWVDGETPVDISGVPVFHARRSMGKTVFEGDGDLHSEGLPVFAFAGIASPETFFEGLRTSGHEVRGVRSFHDHHPYSPRDLKTLIAEAR